MKIVVIGFAGSGKSTLAKRLAEHYQLQVLHLDALHFQENWVERDDNSFEGLVQDFLNANENWVIDGNYIRIAKNRFELADIVIYLKYNRFVCLKGVISRYRKNKNMTRGDMAVGCNEKLDFEFLYWVFHKGRTFRKKKNYQDIVDNAKIGHTFKNRKALNKFLISIGLEVK